MTGDVTYTQGEVDNITSSLRDALEGKRSEIRTLRKSLQYVHRNVVTEEQARFAAEADRDKYRDWVKTKFLWFVDIHAENKTLNMPFMIKEFTKLFSSCDPFYWG